MPSIRHSAFLNCVELRIAARDACTNRVEHPKPQSFSLLGRAPLCALYRLTAEQHTASPDDYYLWCTPSNYKTEGPITTPMMARKSRLAMTGFA